MTTADIPVAYKNALAQKLLDLRMERGLTRRHVHELTGVPLHDVELYEAGERRPMMTRLMRLCSLYGVDVLDMLVSVSTSVQGHREELYAPQTEAFLYFLGVTPEQIYDGGYADAEPLEPLEVSIRDRAKGRRSDHPERVRACLELRQEYAAGASIRDLAVKHHLSFGSVHNMLRSVDTELRAPGRPDLVG